MDNRSGQKKEASDDAKKRSATALLMFHKGLLLKKVSD
jgi:hypothetical protein